MVVWASRRSVSEYTGFLELVWRLSNKAFDVIDITDLMLPAFINRLGNAIQSSLAVSTGILSPKYFFSNDVNKLRRPLNETERAQYLNLWKRLRQENTPVRVLEHGQLLSAPLSYFDDRLLGLASEDWSKAAHLIGDALGAENDANEFQSGDAVYWSRLLSLVKQRQLEARGDLSAMGTTELRLPR